MARRYHDGHRVTDNDPWQRWQREADVDVDTCLRSRSRPEEDCREHC